MRFGIQISVACFALAVAGQTTAGELPLHQEAVQNATDELNDSEAPIERPFGDDQPLALVVIDYRKAEIEAPVIFSSLGVFELMNGSWKLVQEFGSLSSRERRSVEFETRDLNGDGATDVIWPQSHGSAGQLYDLLLLDRETRRLVQVGPVCRPGFGGGRVIENWRMGGFERTTSESVWEGMELRLKERRFYGSNRREKLTFSEDGSVDDVWRMRTGEGYLVVEVDGGFSWNWPKTIQISRNHERFTLTTILRDDLPDSKDARAALYAALDKMTLTPEEFLGAQVVEHQKFGTVRLSNFGKIEMSRSSALDVRERTTECRTPSELAKRTGFDVVGASPNEYLQGWQLVERSGLPIDQAQDTVVFVLPPGAGRWSLNYALAEQDGDRINLELGWRWLGDREPNSQSEDIGAITLGMLPAGHYALHFKQHEVDRLGHPIEAKEVVSGTTEFVVHKSAIGR
ncbi:MAG: hypothetical protein ACI8UO_006207 [Verrucomicrobiales bacterium]|jgi:hypothetical protein